VEFASRRGNLLVGDIHRNGAKLGDTLVLCHGMESTRGGTKQTAIVERFLPKGLSVFRFDFSFVGESEGKFEDMTIGGEVDDALGALDFIREFEPGRVVLVGSSLGGAVALLTASQARSAVDAVATIAAVADSALFTSEMTAAEVEAWRRTGRRQWREGFMKSSFLDDAERTDILAAVAAIEAPLLVMHGEADGVVPPGHARAIEAAASAPVTLKMFPGVSHRFEEPDALEGLLTTLEHWLDEAVLQ
jgi:putative redox protein